MRATSSAVDFSAGDDRGPYRPPDRWAAAAGASNETGSINISLINGSHHQTCDGFGSEEYSILLVSIWDRHWTDIM
jgi:hypothetical protein